MGIVLKRLGAAMLVLGAIYATYFRAVPSAKESTSDPSLRRLYELGSRQRQAMVLWSAHAARDSALARVNLLTIETGEPQILLAGFPKGTTSPEAEALIRKRWELVGVPDPSTLVAVMLLNNAVFDSLRPQVYPYSGALITAAKSGEACVAITYGSLDPRGNIDIVGGQLDRALAPCLLRAAFGSPGSGVRNWLDRTRFAAVKSNAWLYRPKDSLDGRGQLPWEPMYDEASTKLPEGGLSSIAVRLAVSEITMMLAPPYLMGAPALRCLAGNRRECLETVLQPVSLPVEFPHDLTSPWLLHRRAPHNAILSPHPVGDWFVSDIIRQEGRERFAQFWKSDQSLETAFRDAFGTELGAWTHEWGIRQGIGNWGEQYSNARVILGASLKPSWPLLALGWTAVAILMAAWTAKRRQVTP